MDAICAFLHMLIAAVLFLGLNKLWFHLDNDDTNHLASAICLPYETVQKMMIVGTFCGALHVVQNVCGAPYNSYLNNPFDTYSRSDVLKGAASF